MEKEHFTHKCIGKKRMAVLAAFLLSVNLTACGTSASTENSTSFFPGSTAQTEKGSAGDLKGTTVIVSIIADDAKTSWDLTDSTDIKTLADMRDNVLAACDWISEQAAQYDTKADFVVDWREDEALRYEASFKENLVTAGGTNYKKQQSYIQKNVDTKGLLEKYNADNIIYFFYLNTPYENTISSWTLTKISGESVEEEIGNLYAKVDGDCDLGACTIAHELLHCFGAQDLYTTKWGIPQKYIDYLEKEDSRDIMYSIGDDGEYIEMVFTDVDAYYTGLIGECGEVKEWGLPQH